VSCCKTRMAQTRATWGICVRQSHAAATYSVDRDHALGSSHVFVLAYSTISVARSSAFDATTGLPSAGVHAKKPPAWLAAARSVLMRSFALTAPTFCRPPRGVCGMGLGGEPKYDAKSGPSSIRPEHAFGLSTLATD